MKKTLARLRNKPEKVREQIAILAAGVVTIVIIVVWVVSLQNRFAAVPPQQVNQDQSTPEAPLNLLFNSLQQGIKEQHEELKTTNPFAHDETNVYQTDTMAQPEIDMSMDQSVQQESAITDYTTTENDPSKDQIIQ